MAAGSNGRVTGAPDRGTGQVPVLAIAGERGNLGPVPYCPCAFR